MKQITDFLNALVKLIANFLMASPMESFIDDKQPCTAETEIESDRLFTHGYTYNNDEIRGEIEEAIDEANEGCTNRTYFVMFIWGISLLAKLISGSLLFSFWWLVVITAVMYFFNVQAREKTVDFARSVVLVA